LLKKIRRSLESKPLVVDGKKIKITASFGVKELDISETIESNIKAADEKSLQSQRTWKKQSRVLNYSQGSKPHSCITFPSSFSI
jgi:GGDEF domain-containing protein